MTWLMHTQMDSSRIMDDLFTSFQRSLMDMLFMGDTINRSLCVAVCCSVFAVCCSGYALHKWRHQTVSLCCSGYALHGWHHQSVSQIVAVCCNVLKYVAVCCNELQSVAVCCSVLQCVAVCCSQMQCVAAWCNCVKGTSCGLMDMGWLRLVGSLKL